MKYNSDAYGRMEIRFPDPRQALGAIRFRAFDGEAPIELRYRAMFMLEGDRGVVTSNQVSHPIFAPENTRAVQFLKAVQLSLGPSAQEFEIRYSGTVSYYMQPIQTPYPSVGSGEWLGNTSTGAEKAWLSQIYVTISRRSHDRGGEPPFVPPVPSDDGWEVPTQHP
ncbi:hypothetical protein [Mesorhizobium sp.]|uniref:hypothetical protein n=1 Tax=Mesorhizobium sp. TaxID=1871066 RepID=UPI000FE791A3|nr:hypothetical protein [Mesorhizobium sp.]RWG08283.1 MAG: hypothetical protein EOQ54_00975 [Mesorhizobium sp.]TIR89026.1 MAG: hypothetical protein E5X08_29245 [Mesorhizobium sp.]